MKNITREYTNGEVTIVWKPEVCIHSGNCFRGLNEVFDPRKRPWVTPDGITSEKIMDQIKKCPSGALGYYLNKDLNKEAVAPKQNETALPTQDEAEVVIEATRNGPLLVHGTVSIKDQHGAIIKKKNAIALCRCGGSGNKPFCDGTHKKTNFEG